MSEEAVRNLGALHEDFERYFVGFSDAFRKRKLIYTLYSNPALDSVHMKISADIWIVGRRSEYEESHVVVKKAEASLTDIEGATWVVCIRPRRLN